ncbi:hypothetical protein CJ030_MR5G003608 [Morella rubra]|uniref:GRF-type domain-containing protein n=1 Tax=Morella rubra TaxID=262757 RepID=A0A6A1VK59_9ROSI|nr:hypothetical protein CJ030_MR5G003608 [Morella rubra]
MSGFFSDVVTYSSIMYGLCKHERLVEAKVLLMETEKMGVNPNHVSYTILLDSLLKARRAIEAFMIQNQMHDFTMFCQDESRLDLITRCDCGLRAPFRTSWTDINLGRRFFDCALYNGKSKLCGFFFWFDPRTCPRGMEVEPHLMKKIKDLRGEMALLKRSHQA